MNWWKRRGKLSKTLIIIGVLFVALLVGCSTADTPVSVAPAPTAMVNAPVTTAQPPAPITTVPSGIGAWGDELFWQDGFNVTAKAPEEDPAGKPESGKRIVVVDVYIVNGTAETQSYNPLAFGLQDANGYVYDGLFAMSSREPDFSSGELLPSASVRGFLAYEVPSDAVVVSLQFNDYTHQAMWK